MKLRHDMLAHGVNVVCAEHKGKRGGLAVAWATQVGTERVLICVGSQSATRKLILSSGAFGLSVLGRDQQKIAHLFGRYSSRDRNKFESIGWHTAETGSPLLDDCSVALDCRVEDVHERGDAKLIVGRIVSAERRRQGCEPLIYREEDY
ncbi:MAG: flavin reductase family protein [Candidatus Eisenbacteria bacterium]|nr:flavin reductase family protein [Candidatus Eisenbacteria bacterium]